MKTTAPKIRTAASWLPLIRWGQYHILPLIITMLAVHAVSNRPETIKVVIMARPFRYILLCILSSNKVGNSICRVLRRKDAILVPTELTIGLKPMTVVKRR